MMQNITKKKIIIIAVSWLLVLICMGLIFCFSSQVAEQSDETSEGLLQWLLETFHISSSNFIIRKLAHLSEYCGLSALVFNALFQTAGKPKLLLNLLIPLFYAASDEIHQLFVEGRACQLFDVGVDMLGVIIGILGCMVIWTINFMFKKKKIDR